MARKYRRVDPRIWSDEKFRSLTPEEKLLALWMLTSDRTNRCGFVQWSPGLASEQTGLDRHQVDTVCHTVCHTVFWTFDPAANLVFLRSWWKYNQPANKDALKGAMADLEDMPRNSLKPVFDRACEYLKPDLHTVYHTVSDTVYPTVYHTVSPQEQEQEQEQEEPSEDESRTHQGTHSNVSIEADGRPPDQSDGQGLDKPPDPTARPAATSNPSGGELFDAGRPEEPPPPDLGAAFGDWWQAYGLKVKRARAEKAYRASLGRFCKARKLKLVDAIPALLEITRRFRESFGPGKAPEFYPHPTSWLNADRWDDDPDAWASNRRGNGQPAAPDNLALLRDPEEIPDDC